MHSKKKKMENTGIMKIQKNNKSKNFNIQIKLNDLFLKHFEPINSLYFKAFRFLFKT